MCPRAPTLYYNQEKLCLFESNWKEGCNLERSRLDLRASWGHRPPQVALSLLLLSICWNNTPHSVEDEYYLDDSDGDSCIEKKFLLALCPCLSTVAYLIPFLSSERPSQCYHFTKEVRPLQCNAFENPDHHVTFPPNYETWFTILWTKSQYSSFMMSYAQNSWTKNRSSFDFRSLLLRKMKLQNQSWCKKLFDNYWRRKKDLQDLKN